MTQAALWTGTHCTLIPASWTIEHILGEIADETLPIEPHAHLTEAQLRTELDTGPEEATVLRMWNYLAMELALHILVLAAARTGSRSSSSSSSRRWRRRWRWRRRRRGWRRRRRNGSYATAVLAWTLARHTSLQLDIEQFPHWTIHQLYAIHSTPVVTGPILTVWHQFTRQMTTAVANASLGAR